MNLLSNDHGTASALHRHLLYGTSVCDACLDFQVDREHAYATAYLTRYRYRTALAVAVLDVKDHHDDAA